MRKISTNGWLEAAIAWEVCASLHRYYCRNKDPFFTTRQRDFVGHAKACRTEYLLSDQWFTYGMFASLTKHADLSDSDYLDELEHGRNVMNSWLKEHHNER